MQGVLSFAAIMLLIFFLSCVMLVVLDATVFHEADLSYLFTVKSFTSELAKSFNWHVLWLLGRRGQFALRLPDFEI